MHQPSQSLDSTDARGMGREDRATEAFRAECEAQYVLAKPFAERRIYLEAVGRIRGAAARAYLEQVMLEEWRKRKAAQKGG